MDLSPYASALGVAAPASPIDQGDGDPDENRRTLAKEISNATDPRIKAVLQGQLSQLNGGTRTTGVAKNMRDGFPELSGSVAPAPQASNLSPYADALGVQPTSSSTNAVSANTVPTISDDVPRDPNALKIDIAGTAASPPAPASNPIWGAIKQGAGNLAAGAVRGAGSIGATLLTPVDAAAQALGIQNDYIGRDDRRAAMDAGLTTFGAQPDSIPFQVGKLGAEVAGTAGVGGALGAGAKVLGAAPEVVSALGSGGVSLGGGTTGSTLGNLALRSGAGAFTGAATAGAVDPSNVGAGAGIGAVTPGAAWLLGAAGNSIGAISKHLLGGTTGTGGDVVGAAFKAGQNGNTAFLDNMRGNANFGDIVDQAKEALATMRAQRGADYRQGMAAVSGDKTVLDMTPIQQAVADAQSKFGRYNGQVVNENADNAISRVSNKLSQWADLDPATFHTPEGLDKLKQWVGGEMENTQPGSQTQTALKGIYSAIKNTVADQAPTYAKTMQSYADASDQLKEITKALSLGDKASVDTSVRKLQSVLRNNVNTAFGNRAANVKALEEQGGVDLMPSIAGQSMSSWWPRGIAGAVDAAAAIPAAIHNPALLAGGVAASPRLVGEAAYKAGQFSSLVGNVNPIAAFPMLGSQSAALADQRRPKKSP